MKNKYTVIEFYAEWCGACMVYKPVFKKVMDKYIESNSEISFQVVNIDDNEDRANEFDIRSIPTTLILENGKEVGRKLGFMTSEKLEDFIEGKK